MSTRNVPGPGHMSFHARVGQPVLARIGVLPAQLPKLPLGSAAPIHGIHKKEPVPSNEKKAQDPPAQAGLNPNTARGFGFPIPGLQDPSPESVVGTDYFVREDQFEQILNDGDYDYIVIGSGFMALAFIQEAWERNANARILVLERGKLWLPSHFQNLPLPFRLVLGGRAETFPWTVSEQTFREPNVPGLSMAFLRGSCPFFGGKSTVWSAWCPNPLPDRFRDFPQTMIDTMKEEDFWRKANELLRVTPANEICNGIFGFLQNKVDEILENNLDDIPSALASEPAKLAVGRNQNLGLRFAKYSVPGPLLSLVEKFRSQITISSGSDAHAPRSGALHIVTDCVVNRLGALQQKHVRSVETSRGTLSFMSDHTKIILCAGVVPNATLVLNSFPRLRHVAGRRLTGHSMSHVTARVAREALGLDSTRDHLQLAANYLHGENKQAEPHLQYHIQVTAIYCPKPDTQMDELVRECPDFAAAPTLEQLETSTEKVVFVCATLGEMEDGSSSVKFSGGSDHPSPDPDPTTNVTVRYEYTPQTKAVWNIFDDATFEALEVMSNGYELEYWHEGVAGEPGLWNKERPTQREIRIPGVVHEASTLFMGPERAGGSVNKDYLLHGTENVYVTGAALFPTCGSWNPTVAMCGFARDLAKKIVPKYGQ